MPLARTSASNRFIVSSGPKPLLIDISPSAAIACTPHNHIAAIAARPMALFGRTLAISFFAEEARRIEFPIGRESVAVGHLDLRQALAIELAIRGKDAI